MKNILLIVLSFVLIIFASGCQNETVDIEKQEVTINLPYDDSVNGYRTETNSNTFNTFTEEELDKAIEEILKQEIPKEQTAEKTKEENSNTEETPKIEQNKDETSTQEENINQKDEVESTNTQTVSVNYCGNKNSKVFHNATCGSIKNMSDGNKVYLQSRADYIQNGYTPCKRCNP